MSSSVWQTLYWWQDISLQWSIGPGRGNRKKYKQLKVYIHTICLNKDQSIANCRLNLNEPNGDLKCCDSLISLQETLNKDIDAKIEKQLSKRTKLNSSLPSLPSLNEDIDEILANKIADLEKQLRERDDIIKFSLHWWQPTTLRRKPRAGGPMGRCQQIEVEISPYNTIQSGLTCPNTILVVVQFYFSLSL